PSSSAATPAPLPEPLLPEPPPSARPVAVTAPPTFIAVVAIAALCGRIVVHSIGDPLEATPFER
ncbi:MAG: hypothetical protein ACRDVE_06385, partial [Actinocrinis sp.]